MGNKTVSLYEQVFCPFFKKNYKIIRCFVLGGIKADIYCDQDKDKKLYIMKLAIIQFVDFNRLN